MSPAEDTGRLVIGPQFPHTLNRATFIYLTIQTPAVREWRKMVQAARRIEDIRIAIDGAEMSFTIDEFRSLLGLDRRCGRDRRTSE